MEMQLARYPSFLQLTPLVLFAFLLADCGINNIPTYDEQVNADH
jgi:hypothetical protein